MSRLLPETAGDGWSSGVVTDPSDAVIPGATVQLKDEGTGAARNAFTLARDVADPAPSKLIGADGRANPAFLAPPTTPGEQGQLVYLRTPKLWNLDASMNKTVPLTSNGVSPGTRRFFIGATRHRACGSPWRHHVPEAPARAIRVSAGLAGRSPHCLRVR